MTRTARSGFAWAVVLVALAVLTVGCGGGDGGNVRMLEDQLADAEAARLEAEQKAAAEEAARLEAEQEAADAQKQALEAENARLKAQLEAAQAETADDPLLDDTPHPGLPGATDTTPTDTATTDDPLLHPGLPTTGTTPDTPGDDTTTTTPPATTPATQSAEASQRAKRLMDAFGSVPMDAQTLTDSPVSMTVPGSLRFERGGYSTATLGGAGLRSATMTLAGGGGKTVIYTDRELNRELLKHYTPDTADMTRLAIGTAVGSPAAELTTEGQIPVNHRSWKITHSVSTALAGVDHDSDSATPKQRPASPTNPNPRASYSGSLHGVGGTYVCGGASCQIQLTPNYAGTEGTVGDSFALESVTLVNMGGDGLFFKPSNTLATIPLRDGGPVGADTEYMVFGYWRKDPANAAAPYQYDVFADISTADATEIASSVFPVYYGGKAVGAYVERDPGTAVETYRQGEFTADVSLKATAADALTGTVAGFQTTPTGGSSAPRTSDSWVLALNDSNAVVLNQRSTAGAWNHQVVGVRPGETVSPTVAGEFHAEVANFLSIVGAFGATKE